jgi:hypothetical protein
MSQKISLVSTGREVYRYFYLSQAAGFGSNVALPGGQAISLKSRGVYNGAS